MSKTQSLQFARHLHPTPLPADQRAALLKNPGFGRVFTDHMVSVRYHESKGWHDAKIEPRAPWDQEGKLSVQARDSGINVTMAKYRRPSPETAPGHAKVAGLYVICGIEKDRALKAGFDDALMLDWKGRLAESTGANVFLVIDGTLVTPTPENFLDGITRRAVMGMAAKRGWLVEERAVMPEELGRASEVFLSGTAAEIVPVGSIDGQNYQAGPVARTLMADFQKLVREPDCEGFGESMHLAGIERAQAA